MTKTTTFLFTLIFLLCGVTTISANSNGEKAEKKITLKYVTWDSTTFDFMTIAEPINELYKQTHPNVEIELEKSKDSDSFEQTMQIRATAGELPDILPLKTYMLDKYKDLLVPLNDHPSTVNNKFAELYSIDGNILGLPVSSFNEFIYYRKSIYKELGLTVPNTWGEYLNNLNIIKKDGRYTPLAMGLKDGWPDYPFNEYMPLLESGSGNYYNDMAEIDEPFTKGTPFYNTYEKLQEMYDMEIMGTDPLGMGFDQVKAQFAAGEAAMIAAGQWFVSDYTDNLGGDVSDLGIFFLPVRESISEPIYATVMADMFFTIPSSGDNVEAAKEFITWFFDVYYELLLPGIGVTSTVKGVEVTDNPVLSQIATLEEPEYILITADGSEFTKIKNNIQFDVKALGQEMYVGYYDSFDDMMQKLNAKWFSARK